MTLKSARRHGYIYSMPLHKSLATLTHENVPLLRLLKSNPHPFHLTFYMPYIYFIFGETYSATSNLQF